MEDIITQEIEVLKKRNPERNFNICAETGKSVKRSYLSNFAKKTGLHKIISENAERDKIYECDLCSNQFKFKNSMVKHRKIVHLLE